MKNRCRSTILSLFIGVIFSVTVVVLVGIAHAAASDAGSGGGGGAEGGSSSDPSVNCTTQTHNRCNRWIKVSKETFRQVWESGHTIGTGYSSSAYDTCLGGKNKSGYIIMAGQIKSKRFGTLTLWNLTPKPSYLSHNYKTYWRDFAYDYESGTFRDVLSDAVDPTGADPRTYWDIMTTVMNNMGIDEEHLAFFCQGMENPSATPTIYTQSNSSVRDSYYATEGTSGDYQATNIMSGADSGNRVATSSTTVMLDSSGEAKVKITFSHNIYSDMSVYDAIGWTVTRDAYRNGAAVASFTGDSTNFSITGYAPGANSSNNTDHIYKSIDHGIRTTITSASGIEPPYIADSRPYSDGAKNYVLRDSYEVTFKTKGVYKFCETFQDDPYSTYTVACNEITVDTPPPIVNPDTCPITVGGINTPLDPTSTSVHSGTTSAISGVRSNVHTAWDTGKIYAKPTDSIDFAHCYFPRSTTVKRSSGTHNISDPGYEGQDFGHNGTCGVSVTRTIGEQDTFVELNTGNKFTVINENGSEDSLTSIIGTPRFGTINGPFTTTSINSPYTFNGTVGNANGVSIVTDHHTNTVRATHAGQTFGEHIQSDNMGTSSSEVSHSGHSWTHTGKYQTYDCTSCCSGGTEENPCSPGYSWVDHSCSFTSSITEVNNLSSNTWYDGTHAPGGVSNSAQVYIPYNYETRVATLIDNASSGVVYAGETAKAHAIVGILPRQNNTTSGNYATETPTGVSVVMVKFYIPYNRVTSEGSYTGALGGATSISSSATSESSAARSVCSALMSMSNAVTDCDGIAWDSRSSRKWNPDGNMGGATVNALSNSTTNVADREAGSLFCVTTAIRSPYSGAFSGDSTVRRRQDTNENGAGSVDMSWRIGSASCRTIAKKPNFQVLGGSASTKGAINTSIAMKSRNYMSWDEFAIIGNSSISNSTTETVLNNRNSSKPYGMASGASAYAGIARNNQFTCNASPLTIANNDCDANITGRSNIGINSTVLDRLVDRFTVTTNDDNKSHGATIDIADERSYTTHENHYGYRYTRLTRGNTDITNNDNMTISKGTTYVIYSTGDITIKDNLVYDNAPADGASLNEGYYRYGYREIADIPQYIIMADGDIKIDESVSRIDAWLISTGGVIDTCYTGEIGSADTVSANGHCRNQLTINGPVIAKRLNLKRTNGAGTGSSSADPAEIFNLTPSTPLWAYYQAIAYPQAATTYLRELAPRY